MRKIRRKLIKEEDFGFVFVLLKKYREKVNVEDNKNFSDMEGINKSRDQEGVDLRKVLRVVCDFQKYNRLKKKEPKEFGLPVSKGFPL